MKKFYPSYLRATLVVSLASSLGYVASAEEIDSLYSHVNLSELTVTATKTDRLKRELPSSVSILDRGLLDQRQFQGIKDLNAQVPNIYIPDFGSSLSTPIYIRGIGSRRINMIGLYSDGVPLLEGASLDIDYSDIRSVEVLRGPQGTLYGRGAMGGIINLTSYRPLSYQATQINLVGGQYGLAGVNAQSYQKMNDKFGVSAAVNYLRKGGYYTNAFNKEKVDKSNNSSLKLALQYKSRGWDIYLFGQYQERKQGGYPYARVDAQNVLMDVNYNQPSHYNRRMLTTGLSIQKLWANGIRLKSSSSYQHIKDELMMDQDFSAAPMITALQNTRKNLWTQEFNLSRSRGRYSWVTGVYGFAIGSDKFLDNRINIPKRNNSRVYINYDEPSYGLAVYHQSTYKITERLTAELGLRYDWEWSKQKYSKETTDYLADASVKRIDLPASTIDRQFTPKLSLSYRLGATQQVYASVLRGYQPSGFNVQFDRLEEQSYKPEYSWNYELGTHLNFADGKLSIDASAFYIDWRQQQVQQAIISTLGSKIINAGKSRSFGAEIAVSYRPIEGLGIMASYGYTNAKFVEYSEYQAPQVNASRNGNYIPQVPMHTVAGAIDYGFKTNWSWLDDVRLGVQYRGLGDIYWDSANAQKQGFYSLLDAQVSFGYKFVSLELWAKNLSNTNYRSYQFVSQGQKLAQKGQPRHFGATLRLKF